MNKMAILVLVIYLIIVFGFIVSYTIDMDNSDSAENISPVADETAVSYTKAQGSSGSNVSIIFNGSNSTDSDGAIVSYNWDYGDGDSGTGIIANHTYSLEIVGTEITYNVSLTVTDDRGVTDTSNFTVTIQPSSFFFLRKRIITLYQYFYYHV